MPEQRINFLAHVVYFPLAYHFIYSVNQNSPLTVNMYCLLQVSKQEYISYLQGEIDRK